MNSTLFLAFAYSVRPQNTWITVLSRTVVTALIAAQLALVGCSDSGGVLAPPPEPPIVDPDNPNVVARLVADIIRTDGGYPHVFGLDPESLGYGIGYVQANDQLCDLAEAFTTVQSLRSFFFGGDNTYVSESTGTIALNRNSDFYHAFVMSDARMDDFREDQEEVVQLIAAGYAQGYNRYASEWTNNEHPGRHETCNDGRERFVRPITELDVYRRALAYASRTNSGRFIDEIATAQPPTANSLPVAVTNSFPNLVDRSHVAVVGGQETDTGSAMLGQLVAQPLSGPDRLFPMHQVVGTSFNVAGFAPLGIPLPVSGFNNDIAYALADSPAYGALPYELTLSQDNALSFQAGSSTETMQAVQVTITDRAASGSAIESLRTLYRTTYGPIFGFYIDGTNVLPWTNDNAYSLRDATLESNDILNHLLGLSVASSLSGAIGNSASFLGAGGASTNVASGEGGAAAYFGLLAPLANIDADEVEACTVDATATIEERAPNLPILNAADNQCRWSRGSSARGTRGFQQLPQATRVDYTVACSDSHWLPNAEAVIEGFPAFVGTEGTQRTDTGRGCLTELQRRVDDADGLGAQVTHTNLQSLMTRAFNYTGGLLRDDAVSAYCEGLAPLVSTEGNVVDATEACTSLANWDTRNSLGSTTTHLWREFWSVANDNPTGLYDDPFDPADPVNTPRDLNELNPSARTAFADAVEQIESLGLSFDATVAELQSFELQGEAFTTPGGLVENGAQAAVPRTALTADGYAPVANVPAVYQVASFPPTGARGSILNLHGQSTDPAHGFALETTRDATVISPEWTEVLLDPDAVQAAALDTIRIILFDDDQPNEVQPDP